MPQHSSTLQRFISALSSVYGPLDDLTAADAPTWNPPTDPGAGGHRGRYLWTDAFGLIDLLKLHRETSSPLYLALARRLADVVHDTLGRERECERRPHDNDGDGNGGEGDGGGVPARLPGATDAEPLRGGLRIGKLDAHGPDADGQYHHYLTLWMFALNRLSLASGEARWNDLAVQLARAVHPRFVLCVPSPSPLEGEGEGEGERRHHLKMVWKISTDMRRVLVPSEGHLDAATGLVVYSLLQRTAVTAGAGDGDGEEEALPLAREIAEYARLMTRRPEDLTPRGDPLDLGMGLWVCQFGGGAVAVGDQGGGVGDDLGDDGSGGGVAGSGSGSSSAWAQRFVDDALGLARVLLGPDSQLMRRDASRRLAFREFGACLGVRCAAAAAADQVLQERVRAVLAFWERHQQGEPDDDDDNDDLRPISKVMYAAALVPGAFCRGYLGNETP
ncbi:hypothetical protein JDV02_004913 [Purpureocillium takamizusanense]|uniref:Uncharacterized protein n=1 Tax=Purpureocillium takamizusanense TaxID=2060973 RepID=A0A9Q8QGV6_9HYPO|nr:uncharacterized protein JDV02_004913 [Purpureocillium takamizusanense]UNI18659.1 hypothetical protein JDV02_004913 [Purpureocillium takamizusanense]